jgi:hypothetical protein
MVLDDEIAAALDQHEGAAAVLLLAARQGVVNPAAENSAVWQGPREIF